MDERLKELKKDYENVPIPKELDEIIEMSLQNRKKKKKPNKVLVNFTVAAAAFILFTVSLNASPTMAKSLSQIPIISSVVEVLTFTKYEWKDDNVEANIEVPQVTGDSEDIQTLNAKFVEEGKQLFEQFKVEIKDVEQGHLGVDSGYIVETNTDKLLSFGRYVVTTMGSASEEMTYTTIDKEKQIVITLPSLFKDSSYIPLISNYIKEKMREEINTSKGETVYWVSGTKYVEVDEGFFEQIADNQNFYITEQGKLVISFDEAEVAPSYYGLVTFEIPTEILQPVLVSDEYIK